MFFFKWPTSAGPLARVDQNPSGSETRVDQKPEWIRNPSGLETRVDQKPEWIRTRVERNCRISLCITRTSITHIPEWPVVRVFVCTSGPANHRKCTSWITAKEHVHLTSHATAKEHVIQKRIQTGAKGV